MIEEVYVIVEVGFEYDDNNYRQSSGDGGYPVKYFKDKNLAQIYCDERNVETLLNLIESGDLPSYIEEIDEDIAKVFKKIGFGVSKNRYGGYTIDNPMPENGTITKEQAKQISDVLRNRWFNVVKIDNSVIDVYKQKI